MAIVVRRLELSFRLERSRATSLDSGFTGFTNLIGSRMTAPRISKTSVRGKSRFLSQLASGWAAASRVEIRRDLFATENTGMEPFRSALEQ
jgi:hypothetical protein